ncbi:MAG: hypothetical protein QOD89_1201 [Bradyrhizobium sp.]|jgi:hypothetical protein|nr:hypothetical protein [Bradyrhizobium sp.]
MDLDAEHRALVIFADLRTIPVHSNGTRPIASRSLIRHWFMEAKMGRGVLLWLLGVPIPIIILLWLFFGR